MCAGVDVDVHLGSWARAVEFAPFDLVVCNPPYVPHDPRVNNALPATIGPARAWNAGYDGRLVLDPLCQAVPDLLADRGSLLLVTVGIRRPAAHPCRALRCRTGRRSRRVAMDSVRAGADIARLVAGRDRSSRSGRREEELLVIRADKP